MLKIAVFTNNPNAQDFYEKMAGLKEESLKEGSLSLLHVFRSRIFPELVLRNHFTGNSGSSA